MFRPVSSRPVCCGAAAFANADLSLGIGTYSRKSMQANYSEGTSKSQALIKFLYVLFNE